MNYAVSTVRVDENFGKRCHKSRTQVSNKRQSLTAVVNGTQCPTQWLVILVTSGKKTQSVFPVAGTLTPAVGKS